MKIKFLKYFIATLIAICFCTFSFAQQIDSSSKIHLAKIIINGNKKTKDYIILREMTLQEGDSVLVKNANDALEKSRQFIYNTTLFENVKLDTAANGANGFDIIVTVKERWYIFPIPQFQLVDRSFNEWFVKYNASFERVNYGIKFEHKNLSGRKDNFKLYLINGYTKNASFSYTEPYSNPKLTNGYGFGGGYTSTRELPYQTDSLNNFLYYDNSHAFVKSTFFLKGSFLIRKKLKKKQIFDVLFTGIKIADTIISQKYNPNYFNLNSTRQNIFDISYSLQFTDVNNILYPLTGSFLNLTLQKRGVQWKGGINMFSVFSEYDRYFALKNKWYASMEFSAKIKLPFTQPYYNLRAIGTDKVYLRGLEYYVVDGVMYGLAKFNLKKELFHFTMPTYLPSKEFSRIPIRIYAKVFADAGYVYSDEKKVAQLNNRFLYTEGFGIDILTFYDFHLKLEYAFNQLGQKGLFLHN